MEFDNLYKDIKYIEYSDYEIDHNHNVNILNELKYVMSCAHENNLDVIVTGAISCVIHTSKIFRTISDIDIIVSKKDIKQWFKLLSDRYDYLYHRDLKPLHFLKNIIELEEAIKFRNKKNPKILIEVAFRDKKSFQRLSSKYKIFEKEFKEFNIKYIILQKLFPLINHSINYTRKKDKDDINFYLQFIKYEELLPNPIS